MIEISHQQAQHLIRQAFDRRLPEAQWATLQGHLERCDACRAYRQRLTGAERGMRGMLRLRWSGARGPASGLAAGLVAARARRLRRRKQAGKAARYLLGALAALLVYAILRVTAPTGTPPVAQLPTATALRPTATALALDFRGLVAYAAELDGSSEIVLVSGGSGEVEVTNLTSSPANETEPAWSPDGEWLAFLSDRGPDGQPAGKNELYVMTIAGSRLTRLTSRADLDWQGPLEWSYDGQWIALSARRPAQPDGPVFLYLVPTGGGEPRSIAFTRGAQPWLRFSSTLPLLAYVHPRDGLMVFNIESGWSFPLSLAEAMMVRFPAEQPGAFDWSLGGRSLIYIAEGPYEPAATQRDPGTPGQPGQDVSSMVRISPELDQQLASGNISVGIANYIDRLDGVGRIRSVSWVPNSLQVAALYDRAGCWVAHISHAYNQQVPQQAFSELCVTGWLERTNWTTDGEWLVLAARRPDNNVTALYALHAGEGGESRPAYGLRFERLADLPPGDPPALRVRPVGRALRIDPRPAQAVGGTPAAGLDYLEIRPALPEWVYYSEGAEGATRIFRARPDGSDQQALAPPELVSACPRPGPDGRVAFLGTEQREFQPVARVYLSDEDGSNQVLLTPPVTDAYGHQRVYTCPVWSPDGSMLAAYAFGRAPELALLPADGSPARHLPLNFGVASAAPLWLPNDPADPSAGADRVLLVRYSGSQTAALLEVDVTLAEDGMLAQAQNRATLTGWDDVLDLTLSPDGQTLAALTITYNRTLRTVGPTLAQVRLIDAGSYITLGGVPLNNVDAPTARFARLFWLPDGTLGLARSTARIGPRKSILERFDPSTPPYRAERMAALEDVLFDADAVRTAEGAGWLYFAAEGGLYAQDFHSLLDSRPPVLLSDSLLQEVRAR